MATEDEVKKVVQKYVDSYPENWTHGVACWVAVNKKTGVEPTLGYSKGSACHAGMTNNVAGHFVVNAHHPNKQGTFPEFTKWVCQSSPFSHGVVNSDNEKEILGQACVIDGDLVGRGGALWLVKALRYTVEDTFRIPVWVTLQKHGLDPLQAFIGCSILNGQGGPMLNHTHCGLFRYNTPANLYMFYQELLKEKKRDGDDAKRPDVWTSWQGRTWGELGYKTVKKSDGWGGFTEVREPSDPSEFVEKLKMIFAGDYKNVC